MAGQPLGGLTQDFHSGIGQQGVLAAGALQGMRDEQAEALSLHHGLELHAHLDAAVQRRIRSPLQRLRQDVAASANM